MAMGPAPDVSSGRESFSSTASGPLGRIDARYLWLASAALIAAASTWFALLQDPRPDPWQPVQFLSPDWWQHPVERNAFKRLPAIAGDLRAIHSHKDGKRLWAVGTAGLIVHSADGGRTWTRQRSNSPSTTTEPRKPPETAAPTAPRPPSSMKLNEAPTLDTRWPALISKARAAEEQPKGGSAESRAAAKIGNEISAGGPRTGANARVPAEPFSPDLYAIFFLEDGLKGWAVGDGGTILSTTDGGTSWTRQPNGTGVSLRSMTFTDARTGWIVGEYGTILHTKDGGTSWKRQVSGSRVAFTSVAFTDADTGWAAGAGGTIIHTANGGMEWTPQASGAKVWLQLVAFTDARTGWAVGQNGTILHTTNGGVEWTPQASGTKAWLRSVAFSSVRTGWAVGEDGTILHTTDGGASWTPQARATRAFLSSVTVANDRTAWAVGSSGTILHTTDGGTSWVAQTSSRSPMPRSITFSDARTGWITGDHGTILHTTDGGTSWVPRAIGIAASISSVAFTDARTGWAVGSGGTILHTTNGGTSWVRQKSDTPAWLNSVTFADPHNGWAVGDDGTILQTANSGTTWLRQKSGTRALLSSVTFTDARNGWAVGRGGVILHTTEGGTGDSWVSQKSDTTAWLTSVAFTDDRSGLAVGSDGTILHTTEGGTDDSWKRHDSRTPASLISVAFADARNGWAVGRSGVILHTSNGGGTWVRQTSGTRVSLSSVAFTDARTGWAVGLDGTILHTTDGGANWIGGEQPGAESFLTYVRSPAPWWYLVLLACLGALGMALRPPRAKLRSMGSVADLALSDRPLEATDRDVLAFRPIAQGLSAFLRNTATQPPLTLAITGDWGSGKSSLMNLLRDDLRARGFRPVLFNAWHQPKDANLLAGLVSAIRAQALPPLLTPEGLRFRWQLAWVRTRERPLWVGSMVFLAAYLLTYFGMQPAHLVAAIDWLPHLAKAFGDGKDGQSAGELLAQFKSFAFLVAVLGPLLTAWRGLKAFGVNPGALAASVAGSIKKANAQNRFLHDYARQFQDVAQALRPRTLTIFIDDLDRCPPDQVREALEAVNYLVTSGPCFVVLGMARERVEACVGLAYKDVAQELVNLARHDGGPPESPRPTGDEARHHRRSYARDYLKKLVNIEVPVPPPSESQAKTLVGATAETPAPEPYWKEVACGIAAVWPLVLVVGIAALGWWSGVKTPDVQPPEPPLATAPGPEATSVTPPTSAKPPEEKPEDEHKKSTEAYLVPGQTASIPVPVWLVPLLGLLGAGALTLFRRPPVVERDSADFRRSLANWLPLVAARQNTPREVKRFVNRIRLLAMRQRADAGHAVQIDEPTLVALGALHHLDESLIAPPPVAGKVAQACKALADAGHAWSHRVAAPLESALKEHSAAWPPTTQQILRFTELVGSVRLD